MEDDNFNDGSVATQTEWLHHRTGLPLMDEAGHRVRIVGAVSQNSGGFGIDRLQIGTETKCFPK